MTSNPVVRSWSRWIGRGLIIGGALIVLGVLVWQAWFAQGNPDPTTPGITPAAVVLDTGILVFREGLEAILVLAALTASLVRTEEGYWKPVALGAALSFLATVVTWFIAVGIISSLAENVSALNIQAATGLLAIIVLLVIMNWYFHGVYWTGWITFHNRRKRELTETPGQTRTAVFRGLMLVGFTSVYREGFEVVLFLQNLRLKAGTHLVLEGAMIGLGLTVIVAMLTFVVHYRLPYKKMLILTGVMLGAVLIVMVGESVQECQDAHWFSKTEIHGISMPDWLNTWFAIFNSIESLASQGVALVLVLGSYVLARIVNVRRRQRHLAAAGAAGVH